VIDLLGWFGSGLLVLSLLQRGMLTLRIINLAACVVLVGFNWVIGVWPMVGMNTVVGFIDIYYVWRIARNERKGGGSDANVDGTRALQ